MSYFVRIVILLTDPTDTVGYGLNTESSVLLTFGRLLTCGCMRLTRLDVVPTVVAARPYSTVADDDALRLFHSSVYVPANQENKKIIAKSSLWVVDRTTSHYRRRTIITFFAPICCLTRGLLFILVVLSEHKRAPSMSQLIFFLTEKSENSSIARAWGESP